MGLLRRKRDGEGSGPTEDPDKKSGYTPSMTERMRSIDQYAYDFDDAEAAEVEARIRRMFYGAHVEE